MKKILFILALAFLFTAAVPVKENSSVNRHNVTLLKTDKVNNITQTTADCYLTVAGTDIVQAGFCANTAGNLNINSKYRCGLASPININSGRPKQFYATLKGLSLNTKYFVKAYAKTKDGTVYYENEISFSTLGK